MPEVTPTSTMGRHRSSGLKRCIGREQAVGCATVAQRSCGMPSENSVPEPGPRILGLGNGAEEGRIGRGNRVELSNGPGTDALTKAAGFGVASLRKPNSATGSPSAADFVA